MNCPGGILVYQTQAAVLPRPAHPLRRAGSGAPPRAVRRAARPDARALLHAGRRPHLHDPGPDPGRDQGRVPPDRRGVLHLRLPLPPWSCPPRPENSIGTDEDVAAGHRRPAGRSGRPGRDPTRSTRATARSTARRSTSTCRTAWAVPGSAAPSSWTMQLPERFDLDLYRRGRRKAPSR